MADSDFTEEDHLYDKALEAMGYMMGLSMIEMGTAFSVFIPHVLSKEQHEALLKIEQKHAEEYQAAVLADMQNLFGNDFATEAEVGARLEVAAKAGLAATVLDESLGEEIGPRPRFAGRVEENDGTDGLDDSEIKVGGTD